MILPNELLNVRRRKGAIRPIFAPKKDLSLVKTLISIYESNLNKTRGELKEALSACEELGYNYKVVRGISAILEDRSMYKNRAVVDPILARRIVFEETTGRTVTNKDIRKKILSKAAFRLGVSSSDLEQSLYADLIDEQILTDVEEISPEDLLGEYNLCLTLSILNFAENIEMNYVGNEKELDYLCKRMEGCRILTKNGKSALILRWNPNQKTGYRLAKLEEILRLFVLQKKWKLSADIRYPLKSKKVYNMDMDHELEGKLIKTSFLKKMPLIMMPKIKHKNEYKEQDIVIISEEAVRSGVTEANIRRRLKHKKGNYIELGDVFVSPDKLNEIKEALTNLSDMKFGDVKTILKKLGCSNPLPVLEALGYDVEWRRDRNQSNVYKISR